MLTELKKTVIPVPKLSCHDTNVLAILTICMKTEQTFDYWVIKYFENLSNFRIIGTYTLLILILSSIMAGVTLSTNLA